MRTITVLETGSPGQPPQLLHSFWAQVILRLLLLYIRRNHDYHRWGAQTTTLTFTQPLSSGDSSFTVTLRPQKPWLSQMGSPDYHLDFHTAPELWWFLVHCCFMSIETIRTIRDGEPRLPPWLSHSPWALVVPCSLLLYVHRDHKDYQGWGAQTTTLTFTQPLSSGGSLFTVALCP